jgi:putative ABC transport system permease protein
VPHYFDLSQGSYAEPAALYAPFSTAMVLKLGISGNMNCWGSSPEGPRALNAPCTWVQYWVQLASPSDAGGYRDYLKQYSDAQRAAGRFERPTNVRLRDVNEWLVHRQVLPADVRLQLWLAFGFLLVCLTNTVGLLLAKCLRRSADIGVRRALGATRADVFKQFLVEAVMVGAAGGVLGLLLSALGLWLVRQSPAEYAALAQMDWQMLATTVALALLASALAGLLPAWRASGVAPAQQLKAQ